jgi:hypothetical protein
MAEFNKNTVLKLVVIGWKVGFLVLLGFLAYSIYNRMTSAIVFSLAFLIFIGYAIKRYSKRL